VRHRQGREDRRSRRFDVEGVTGKVHFSVEVSVLNVSAGGMQVATGSHLTVGRQYSFRLRRNGHAVQIQGRVAWCSLRGTSRRGDGEVAPAYLAGVAFERTLTEEGQALFELIREAISVEPEQRAFGRFRVAAGGPATAASEFDFAVRRVSLSGMLIECDLVPQLEQVFPFQFQLGEATFGVSGRVAFVRELTDSGHRAEVGVEFLGLDEEQRQILARFVEEELSETAPLEPAAADA
jgi:hypothetical protein